MSEEYVRSTPRKKFATRTRFTEKRNGDLSVTSSQTLSNTWVDSLTGIKNARWRDQIRQGHNACTPLTAFKGTVKPTTIFLETHCNRISGSSPNDFVYGQLAGDHFPTLVSQASTASLSESLANASALTEYVRAINRVQRTLQGAVALGEMARVVSMIRNPAQLLKGDLHRYIDTVKKRFKRSRRTRRPRKKRKAELQKVVAGTWLEYAFGWVPLLNDIDDGVKAAAESGVLERDFRRPVQGFGVDERIVSDQANDLTLSSWPLLDARLLTTTKVVVVYRGMIDSGSYSAFSPRRVGFAPSDWVPALWELLPWSFLVDYFSNIGNIISAYSLNTTGLLWTNKTVIKSYYRTHTGIKVAPNGGFGVSSSYDCWGYLSLKRGFAESKFVTREPYTGSLVPDLRFSIPGSGLKWLNIAALGLRTKTLQDQIGHYIQGIPIQYTD